MPKGQYHTAGPIPVATLSQAWVCSRSLAVFACSNSAGCLYVLSFVSIGMLLGRGFSDGPIPRPEESYRACVRLSLSVIKCDNNP